MSAADDPNPKPETERADGAPLDQDELRERVLYALFLPSVRVAARFGVPLARMKKLMETAYYHEAQRQGLTMREAMEVMDISISKAALLSRQLKTSFMRADRDYDLPRRVEYALWAGPLTSKRLAQTLKGIDPAAIDAALGKLLEEGKIVSVNTGGRDLSYQLARQQGRRVWNTWLARIDGLSRALDSVTKAAFARFFNEDPAALARTISLHVRRSDRARFARFYEETLFPFLIQLDNDANQAPPDEAQVMSLSVFWTPDDALDATSTPATHRDEDDETTP